MTERSILTRREDEARAADRAISEKLRHDYMDALERDDPVPSALTKQVAGDHYKKMKIQPVEFIHANNIPFIEGCIIKYAARWRDKGGIKDLEKIKHFTDLLIELEARNG